VPGYRNASRVIIDRRLELGLFRGRILNYELLSSCLIGLSEVYWRIPMTPMTREEFGQLVTTDPEACWRLVNDLLSHVAALEEKLIPPPHAPSSTQPFLTPMSLHPKSSKKSGGQPGHPGSHPIRSASGQSVRLPQGVPGTLPGADLLYGVPAQPVRSASAARGQGAGLTL